MRRSILVLLILLLCAGTAAAEDSSSALFYEVADVNVDVTADSAAHARDKAIVDAQREAFGALLERVGADAKIADRLSDDDLATLVQNFEVQSERTSSVRYIGVFTVQFRPLATRGYLAGQGVQVVDTRAPPLVVLPITARDKHPVLWEEPTPWHKAWQSSHDEGPAPVIVPAGAVGDSSSLATADVVAGNAEALKAFIEKYQAGGAVVATLNGDAANPAAGFSVDMVRYDADGNPAAPVHIALPAAADAQDDTLKQGVKLVRQQLEREWRQGLAHGSQQTVPDQQQQQAQSLPQQAAQQTPVTLPPSPDGDPSVQAILDAQPSVHMPVSVAISTLAEWAQIRQRLGSTPGIGQVNVLSLQRGMARIEVEVNASIPSVQQALMQKRLQLAQDASTSAWTLRPF